MSGDGTLYNITDVSDGGVWNGGGVGTVDENGLPDYLKRPMDQPPDTVTNDTSYEGQARKRWDQYAKDKQALEDQYPVWKRVLGTIGEGLRAYGGARDLQKPGPDLTDLNAKYSDIMGQAKEENKSQNTMNREITKQNIIGRFADQRQAGKNKAMLNAVNAKIAAAKAANGGKPLTSDQYMTILLQNYAQAGGFGSDPTSLTSMNMLLSTLGNLKGQAAAGNRELMGGAPIIPAPPGATPAPATAPASNPGVLTRVLDAITGRNAGATPASRTAPSAPGGSGNMPETAEQAQSMGWKLHTVNGKSGYVDPTGQYVIPVE